MDEVTRESDWTYQGCDSVVGRNRAGSGLVVLATSLHVGHAGGWDLVLPRKADVRHAVGD